MPVAEPDDAFGMRRRLGDDWLIMGERGGLKVPGFDFGNSPLELFEAGAPKRAVMCTSNGTKAVLAALNGCSNVIIGCPRNLTASVHAALGFGSRFGLVPSGRNGEFSAEDTVCAGMMAERASEILRGRGEECAMTDGAAASAALWTASGRSISRACSESEHGRILRSIGFERDIELCSEVDVSGKVPAVCFEDGLPFIRAE